MKRAVAILDAVSAADEPLTLAQVTVRLGLPKSSVLAICTTLADAGLLQRTAAGRYALGTRVVGLAHAYLAKSNLTAHFLDAWDALGALPEETVVLSVLEGTDVVYVACRNGSQGLTFNYRIGMRLPAACSASGKAMLSTLSDDELLRRFTDRPLAALTPRSVTDVATLRDELAAVRKRGYAIDDEEVREGMCCIGAPIFEEPRRPAAAAVAVSMLKAEFASPKRERAIATVTAFARDLSQRLGG